MRTAPGVAIATTLLLACGGPDAAGPATATPAPCRDVTGEWSSPVDGLRGRLVTSGASASHDALRLTVELENVSDHDLSIHWDGRPSLGFVAFALDDADGVEVPEPPWALGGNEPGGSLFTVVPAGATARHALPDVLDTFDGGRIFRIGTFWARQMPDDGSRWTVRARVTGRAASANDLVVRVDEAGDTIIDGDTGDSAASPWIGPLDLPGVCAR
ncbi:MAG: hypothetical protein H6719_22340 [Sandaracinaceae bacterium]|nr:hypothetical protein [Sandaracinaceae bacterium]